MAANDEPGRTRGSRGCRSETEAGAGRDAVVTRVFDAPREAVWNAWTDPAQFRQWWGPTKHSVPECGIDLRVGGRYLLCERAADGSSLWVTGTYREVVAPERIVATLSFADPNGNVVPQGHYRLHPGLPMEMLITVTLEARGGRTVVMVRQAGLLDDQIRDGVGEGWGEAFDKLEALLG